MGYKFKRLRDNRYVILFIPCPEAYGNDFFKSRKYNVQLNDSISGVKDYVISNKFRNDSLDSFEIGKIERCREEN